MPSSPYHLNANADNDYLASQERRSNIQAAQQYLAEHPEAEAQEHLPPDRPEGTTREGLEAEAATKKQKSEEAGQTVKNLETATQLAQGVSKGLNIVGGAAVLMNLGVPPPLAVAGGGILDKVQQFGAEKSIQGIRAVFGQGHPIAETAAALIGSGLTGAALLGPLAAAHSVANMEAGGDLGEAPGAAAEGGQEGGTSVVPSPVTEAEPAPSATGLVPRETAKTPEVMGEPKTAGQMPPHSIAEMLDEARATPLTGRRVANMELEGEGEHALFKTPIDQMDQLRLKQYAVGQALKASDLAEAVRQGDPEAAKELAKVNDELVNVIAPRIAAVKHQYGLGLRLEQELQHEQDTFTDALSAVGDPDHAKMLDGLASLATPEQRRMMLEQAEAGGKENLGKFLVNYYVQSRLSLGTIFKKLGTDLYTGVMTPAEHYLAEQGDRITRLGTRLGLNDYPQEQTIAPGETHAGLMALKDGGARSAAELAYQALRTNQKQIPGQVGYGEPSSGELTGELAGVQDPVMSKAVDYLGHVIGLPGRGILTVDTFAKAINANMQRAMLSYRQAYWNAAKMGLEGDEFDAQVANHYSDLMNNTPPDIAQAAYTAAERLTMGAPINSGGPIGDLLEKVNDIRQVPLGRVMMPFFPTPVNLWRASLEYGGPLGVLSKGLRDATAQEGSVMAARMALGTVLGCALIHHIAAGNVVGRGPLNPEVRKMWENDGHQPYSIHLLGDRYEIGQLPEPLSGIVALYADGVDIAGRLPHPQADSLGAALTATFVSNLERQGLMKNVLDLFHLMEGGNEMAKAFRQQNEQASEMTPEAQEAQEAMPQSSARQMRDAQRSLRDLLASPVPIGVTKAAQAYDPIHRQVNGILDQYRANIPSLSESLPPEYDALGRPVAPPLGWQRWLGDQISLFRVTKPHDDPVIARLIKLDPVIPTIGGDGMLTIPIQGAFEKVTATPEQIADAQRTRGTYQDPDSGRTLKQYLDDTFKDPEFEQLAYMDQQKKVSQIFTAYTHAAVRDVFVRNFDLQGKYQQARAARVAAHQSNVALGAP